MKRLRKPPLKSSYHRIRGCDCPECSPVPWWDKPSGPWLTWAVVACVIAGIIGFKLLG